MVRLGPRRPMGQARSGSSSIWAAALMMKAVEALGSVHSLQVEGQSANSVGCPTAGFCRLLACGPCFCPGFRVFVICVFFPSDFPLGNVSTRCSVDTTGSAF